MGPDIRRAGLYVFRRVPDGFSSGAGHDLRCAAVLAAESGRTGLSVLFGIPSLAWTLAMMGGTALMAFARIVTDMEGSTVPYLLWAYSVALAPWTYLPSKELQGGGENAGIPVFFVQLGTISMMIAVLIDRDNATASRLVYWVAPFACLGLIVMLLTTFVEGRATGRYR